MTTTIQSNGSRWGGESPAPLEELFDVLASEPLDPSFERYGNFITIDPREGIQTQAGAWEDGPLIFPDQPGLARFWGNFAHLSHVFEIETTDGELIQRLTDAIRANQQTSAYHAVKADRAKARQEHAA